MKRRELPVAAHESVAPSGNEPPATRRAMAESHYPKKSTSSAEDRLVGSSTNIVRPYIHKMASDHAKKVHIAPLVESTESPDKGNSAKSPVANSRGNVSPKTDRNTRRSTGSPPGRNLESKEVAPTTSWPTRWTPKAKLSARETLHAPTPRATRPMTDPKWNSTSSGAAHPPTM